MHKPAIVGGEPAFPEGLTFARPFTPPLAAVTARLSPSFDQGILTNGPLVRQLEEETAARLGVAHVVAVSCCTSGLMLALRALVPQSAAFEAKAAPRVVLPSFTFSASAHAVAWNGLRPTFCECDPASFQIDLEDAAGRVAGSVALLATHIFGAPCQPEDVEALARSAGIPVVFDSAHAFGATRGGRCVGGFGDVEVFSLSPTKLVVSGEGGLVATNRSDVADAVRIGRDYANPGDYNTRFVGLNARMSELHAAVALESLAMLDDHLDRRRALAARYADGLADIAGVSIQVVADGDESTYKDFTIAIDEDGFGMKRDLLMKALKAEGIDTRRYFYPPVHRQRAYTDLATSRLPTTDAVSSRVLSLPMFGALALEAAERVCETIANLGASAELVLAG